MTPRPAPAALAALALAVLAPASFASVPAPFTSTWPAVLVGSPDGAFTSTVTVRDIAGIPIIGVNVTLDFSLCPQFRPCPVVCPACVVNAPAKTVSAVTGADGAAPFALRMGGAGCPNPPTARVYADGILLGTARFAALDQDGDLSVTPADVAAVRALVGSLDLRADFDGDGVVTDADVAIVHAHLGTSCDASTPTRHRTWGNLKSIYR